MKLHIRFYELCWFFLLGAFVYSLLEIVCRGYTHWTMTLTGGTAAVGLYLLHAAAPPKTLLYGQICLPFSGLWFLLCIPAFGICSIAAKRFRLPA